MPLREEESRTGVQFAEDLSLSQDGEFPLNVEDIARGGEWSLAPLLLLVAVVLVGIGSVVVME